MSVSSPRTRMPAADRRAAILRSARQEFARHGFHGAGTAAIARGAGCSEAVLYRHFSSKRALLAATLEAEIAASLPRGAGGSRGADPSLDLPATVEARLDDPETQVTTRLFLLAMTHSDDAEIGASVRAAFGAVRERLRRAIEADQAAGRTRPDVDAGLLTWIWHGLFLAGAVRRGMGDDGTASGTVDAARVLATLLRPGR